MRKGILHIEEYFGDQHITRNFSELQLIAVLLAESEREMMWQSSHSLIRVSPAIFFYFLLLSSIKLKPQKFRDALTKELFLRLVVVWFLILIVSMVSENLPCPSDLWGLSWDDLFSFYHEILLANFGVLKNIANISRLTTLARYRSGALFRCASISRTYSGESVGG